MKTSIWAYIKSLFARDKVAFWFDHFTDYELSLSKMTISELASELERTRVRQESANSIVVEHMLAARLARIQSRASWWSGWLGFAGAMLAAALTFYLGQLSTRIDNTSKVECAPTNKPEVRAVDKPIPTAVPALREKTPEPETVKLHENDGKAKQSSGLPKP